MKHRLKLNHPTHGQSLPELGAIIALVTIVCILALTLFGDHLSALFTNLANNIQTSTAGSLGG